MRRRVLAVVSAAAGLTLATFFSPAVKAYEYQQPPQAPGQGSFTQDPGELSGRPQAAAPPRELVPYAGRYAPGTIIISNQERRLYYILPGNQAIRYGVGVGRPGFSWTGTRTVAMKREWPSWKPPAQMLRRRPDLPKFMEGGPANPLGARAMYLGGTLYRIHGSNEPHTIGQAVSSGCIRMTNEDVVDLYERVKVGTRVVVQ
ncbi:L,D-transpeptidase [Methylocella tundrae]|nr:L,D-transpeptidase [Methylocella tundrae]